MSTFDVTPILKIIAGATVVGLVLVYLKTKLERWAKSKRAAKQQLEWQKEQEQRAAYRNRKPKK